MLKNININNNSSIAHLLIALINETKLFLSLPQPILNRLLICFQKSHSYLLPAERIIAFEILQKHIEKHDFCIEATPTYRQLADYYHSIKEFARSLFYRLYAYTYVKNTSLGLEIHDDLEKEISCSVLAGIAQHKYGANHLENLLINAKKELAKTRQDDNSENFLICLKKWTSKLIEVRSYSPSTAWNLYSQIKFQSSQINKTWPDYETIKNLVVSLLTSAMDPKQELPKFDWLSWRNKLAYIRQHYSGRELNSQLHKLLTAILLNCEQLLGEKPEEDWCIIQIGSLGHYEAAHYSDFEYIYLIKNEAPLAYIKKLQGIFEFIIWSFGESDVDGIPVHFPMGLYIDSYLIMTFSELRNTLEQGVKSIDEQCLIWSLLTPSFLYGSQTLWQDFADYLKQQLARKVILKSEHQEKQVVARRAQQFALSQLQDFLVNIDETATTINLKKEALKPLGQILILLNLYYGIGKQNPLDITQALMEQMLLPTYYGNLLKKALVFLYTLREQTHLFYLKHDDIIALHGTTSDNQVKILDKHQTVQWLCVQKFILQPIISWLKEGFEDQPITDQLISAYSYFAAPIDPLLHYYKKIFIVQEKITIQQSLKKLIHFFVHEDCSLEVFKLYFQHTPSTYRGNFLSTLEQHLPSPKKENFLAILNYAQSQEEPKSTKKEAITDDLDIDFNHIDLDVTLKKFAKTPFTKVRFSNSSILDDASLQKFLQTSEHSLELLYINNCPKLTPGFLSYLAKDCPNLVTLIWLNGEFSCFTQKFLIFPNALCFPRLKFLELSNSKLERFDFRAPNLMTLKAQNCPSLIGKWVLNDINSFPQLSSFALDQEHLRQEWLALKINTSFEQKKWSDVIKFLLLKSHATELDLSHRNLDVPQLKEICDVLKQDLAITVIKLNLSSNDLSDDSNAILIDLLNHNSTIVELTIDANLPKEIADKLHENRVRQYLKTRRPQKQYFAFTEIQLSDAGIQPLIEWLENNPVITLDLKGNSITDAGLRQLAKALKENNVLKSINLCKNPITSRGVEYLLHLLEHNTAIVNIDLDIKEAIVRKIQSILDPRWQNHAWNYLQLERALLKQKTHLNLCGKMVMDHGLMLLAPKIEQDQEIISIDLRDNEITDQGAHTLLKLLNAAPRICNVQFSPFQISERILLKIKACLIKNQKLALQKTLPKESSEQQFNPTANNLTVKSCMFFEAPQQLDPRNDYSLQKQETTKPAEESEIPGLIF